MALPELPPELWAQIYNVLATLSDSYLELSTYLLICKLSYTSLYPRLFETLHVSFRLNPSLREWMTTHRQTLAYAVKRAHIPWESHQVDSDFIVSILETCRHLERVACWISETSFTNLAIARALTSLPHLVFLQIYVLQLSFLFEKKEELSASFLQIEKLCLHFWNKGGTQKAIRALESIDLLYFNSLTRLSLTLERNALDVVPALITMELPPL
ncbi:hypothetical protein DL96DRAFT_1814106 [Flagelloscypha sp. PMI_526]|nr:hypothetical protein DL96DRAFT_1814106 [Flagelloscypha sp. PMI_526]